MEGYGQLRETNVIDRLLFLYYLASCYIRRLIRTFVVFTSMVSDRIPRYNIGCFERWSRQQYKRLKVVGHRC